MSLSAPSKFLGLLFYFFNRSDHVECLLGHIVVLSFDNSLESFYCICGLDIFAGLTCKGFCNMERLAQEPLEFPCPCNNYLVIFRQFLDTEDCDDVLEPFISLQGLLDISGNRIMIFADDLWIKNS